MVILGQFRHLLTVSPNNSFAKKLLMLAHQKHLAKVIKICIKHMIPIKNNKMNIEDEIARDMRISSLRLTNKSKRILIKLSSKKLYSLSDYFSLFLLYRNLITYKEISSLLSKHKEEEAFVLMRFFLERSSLAFKILKDNLKKDYHKINGRRCILELKKHFEYSGKWWGFLSQISHSDLGMFINTYLFSEENSLVMRTHSKNDPYLWFLLFGLIETNLAVIRFLAQKYFNMSSFWKKTKTGEWKYVYGVNSLKKIERWEKELKTFDCMLNLISHSS